MSLREDIVRSVCSHHNCRNFAYTISDMFDNNFDLHYDEEKGYLLDPDLVPKQCYMMEDVTGVVVKITANKVFGTTLEIVEDPNNILGNDHVVGDCPSLYDSLSPLNTGNDNA